jgi:hypothetical protein
MTIDDDILKQLLWINDGLFQLCKRLAEKHDIEISYRLIPLVDDLTHILKKLARTNYTNAATRRILHHLGIVVPEGKAKPPVQAINRRCLKCGYRPRAR